jgi:8-oxo-(d)GTP phosphatase
VRHAAAGSRSEWTDHDDLRPLDDCGRAQADELVRTLARFDVARVVSAEPRRCVDTVQPLADALGLRIEPAPPLGVASTDLDAAIALLRQLGSTDRDAVACSQGEVIPELVESLAERDGLILAIPVRARKGSVWALTFDGSNRLLAADYVPPPRPDPCSDSGRD